MLRQLSTKEVSLISGGKDVYPGSISGYELIGWSQNIIGYDSYITYGLFTDTITEYAIYDIQPIYQERYVQVVYY